MYQNRVPSQQTANPVDRDVIRLTASTLGRLLVRRLAEGNVGAGADGSLAAVGAVQGLARDDSIDLCWSRASAGSSLVEVTPMCLTSKNVLEGELNVAGVKGGGLDEGEMVVA